jgi:hypothetical protein
MVRAAAALCLSRFHVFQVHLARNGHLFTGWSHHVSSASCFMFQVAQEPSGVMEANLGIDALHHSLSAFELGPKDNFLRARIAVNGQLDSQ